jgi:2-oxoglutarate ferredoxin oxidoreductase subunit gamma
MGKILAYSGAMENKEVSWLPSYGPEMRGGTANVSVVISDERISSPVLNKFDTAIILNQQSLDKFEESLKPGGVLLYDPNGITTPPSRTDIEIYTIEATAKATELGLSKIFNMIVLGGYLKIKPVVTDEYIKKGLEKSLPARHHSMIPDNLKAVEIGRGLVVKV